MALPDIAKDTMLDALVGVAVWASLHDGDPGTTGANELTGGSPAYARKQLTWGTAAAGAVSAGLVTFDVPAGATVDHFGLWDAATAGNFFGGNAVSNPETYAGQGQHDLTDGIGF